MIANDLLIGPSSPACTARELLRTLRDLDLGQRIALTPDSVIRIAGCLSRDEPVERGVRYLVRNEDGAEETLTLAWNGGELEVQLHGESRWRRLRTMLRLDSLGRTSAPPWAPDSTPAIPSDGPPPASCGGSYGPRTRPERLDAASAATRPFSRRPNCDLTLRARASNCRTPLRSRGVADEPRENPADRPFHAARRTVCVGRPPP